MKLGAIDLQRFQFHLFCTFGIVREPHRAATGNNPQFQWMFPYIS